MTLKLRSRESVIGRSAADNCTHELHRIEETILRLGRCAASMAAVKRFLISASRLPPSAGAVARRLGIPASLPVPK